MQEYLREQPERLAARPSVHVWLDQVRERKRSAPRRVAGRTILTQRDLGRLVSDVRLGQMDERILKVEDALGRRKRNGRL